MTLWERARLVGSNIQAVTAIALVSGADRRLRAAIERLDEVASTMLAEPDTSRAAAFDDLTEAR